MFRLLREFCVECNVHLQAMFILLIACRNDNVDMARLLIDAGAKVNGANGVCWYAVDY